MGIRIHQLPPAIANQIAAGEVIERPASVVKELLENSFDAGADSITIEIGYGGLNRISISDNGIGIIEEDLPLAIAAHATSKISTLNDLYAIESMGFRGEALASIASIAKVSINSRPAQQVHAVMMQVLYNGDLKYSPSARSVGTTIDVDDLFFNAPVRKRFLKGEKLEFQAIETVVKRFSLSAPHINITLKHNGKLIFFLPAAINEQAKLARLTKIFGAAFIKDAIYLDVEHGGMHLFGWISGPNFQRSQNDRQWVYINHRMVKDKLIHHALKQAYDGLLHFGRFPACLLYFRINTSEVDVNVHPTKHEVRFQQPRLVHDFFTAQLTDALRSASRVSDGQDYNFDSYPAVEHSQDVCEPKYTNSPWLGDVAKSTFNTHGLIERSKQPGEYDFESLNSVVNPQDDEVHNKSKNKLYTLEAAVSWIALNNRYVLVFFNQQPHVVDVIALYNYWVFKQLITLPLPLESRPLLVPVSYPLASKLKNRLDELQNNLNQIGIQIEFEGDDCVLIRTVPIRVPYLEFRQFLESLAELEHLHKEQLLELMCHSQVFDSQAFSSEERMELNQLLLNDQISEFEKRKFFKALTLDDCWKLLHV